MSEQFPPLFKNLEWVVDGKIYHTEGSTKLASKKAEVEGCYIEEYLMRTPKDSYFVQRHKHVLNSALTAIGISEADEIKPLSLDEAYHCYNIFPEKLVTLDEAFFGLEDA